MSENWLSAAVVFSEFGFQPRNLERWRKGKGCPLSRPIKFDPSIPNRILYWRPDLEEVKRIREESATLGPRIMHLGDEYVSQAVASLAPYSFTLQRLLRWSNPDGEGCPFKTLDGPKKVRVLRSIDRYVYKGRHAGRQRTRYFHEGDLAEIRRNLDACYVVSKLRGSGLTREEVKHQFDVGEDLLQRLKNDGTVATWEEARISRNAKGDRIILLAVYSHADLKKWHDSYKRPPSVQDVERRHKEAMAFFRDALADGPALAGEIRRQARQKGISMARLNATRRELGIERAFEGGKWWWRPANDPDRRLEKAIAFLKRLLAEGPVAAPEVGSRAAEAGVTYSYLRQAKAALEVVSGRQLITDPFFWCLPGQTLPGDADREATAPVQGLDQPAERVPVMQGAASNNGATPAPDEKRSLSDLAAYPTRETEKELFARLIGREILSGLASAGATTDHTEPATADGGAGTRTNAVTPPPRLRIDEERVFLDGQPVQLGLTPESREKTRCYLGYLLREAGEWISDGDVDRAENKKEKGGRRIRRWDRVRGSLPPCLRDLIETDPRKGSRLLPAAWRK